MAATEETPLVSRRHDDTYKDEVHEMTLGRRLARHLSQYRWYNPHAENPLGPSLDRAWAYFEHVTLPRHFKPNERSRDVNRRAEAGEDKEPTQLYSVLNTRESDLGDFGLGVGVYFYTLRMLSAIMLVAGIINVPNVIYFNSEAYNNINEGIKLYSLKASAICTDESWAACPTCRKEDWDRFPSAYDRYAEATSSDGSVLSFIKINNCGITRAVGLVNLISLIFVCLAMYLLAKATRRQEVRLDEASQTTTDYAIEVSNPPKDARDPDEWKVFFEKFGKVVSITVALDNEELLVALVKRRAYILNLENLQPVGVTVDPHNIASAVSTAMPLTLTQKLMFSSAAETLQAKIEAIDKLVSKDLVQRKYDVSNVYVIFENEEHQQEALRQLSVGGLSVLMNMKSSVPEHLRFRGEFVLRVAEPPEPSSVRWRDLDETFLVQLSQRIGTVILTIGVVIASCLIVVRVRNHYGILYAAMTVSALSSGIPTICSYITELESHVSEGSKEASNYFKITASLWIVTTILTAFVTPFTDTLDNERKSLIPAMYAIFITELLKTPVKQILDISGNVYRHLLAPRAPDQRRMSAYFSGAKYSLSERYTNMTSVLFMTFYYAMIYPAGFFWASATLATHYFVDKFCLLRTWAPTPIIGANIAELSRLYFFTGSLVAYALMSSYNFASFPYDNACELKGTVASYYVGSFSATTPEGESVKVEISEGDSTFKYCNQDMLRYRPWPAFPATPSSQPTESKWMSSEQGFSFVLGWTSVGVIVCVVLVYLNGMRKRIKRFLFGDFDRHEKQTHQKFSEISDIYGYIPQYKLKGALYPILFCDVSKIGHELIDWEDVSDPSKASHNAIYDIPALAGKDEMDGVFSIVRHWS